jgi:sulfite reductase (NADPH) hemoprotein beta-component
MSKNPAEQIKRNSRALRGTLTESLSDGHTGALRADDQFVIKFHGLYQQDDRDRREEREAKMLERLYSFMIRLRIPGGYLPAEKWEEIHHIAGRYATETIKITTRQTIQLHGVLKRNIKPVIQDFNAISLDSIAACGDVNRNVLCTAHPGVSAVHKEVHAYADQISSMLLPKTRAYYEIWLDEEKLVEKEEDELYRETYLPRKFKIAIAIPPVNDTDVFVNDIGLIAVVENGTLAGFNVAIGGGLGTTHGNPQTYPRLGSLIGFVPAGEKTLKAVYEIVTTQRDYGNREDRKLSKLKYTIDRLGLDFIKTEIEKRCGFTFEAARPFHFETRSDRYGWETDVYGKHHYTVFVENGRVTDSGDVKLKSAFLELATRRLSDFRFTANQNVILADIDDENRSVVASILAAYGLDRHTEAASPLRRNAMACVAMNTCPLALAEGQRYMPELVSKVELLLARHNLAYQEIVMRLTGCPNGCARPYVAEIGFVGTALGQYNLMLGGDANGRRLNKLYKSSATEPEILETLDGLFARYAAGRNPAETFGDYVVRAGIV